MRDEVVEELIFIKSPKRSEPEVDNAGSEQEFIFKRPWCPNQSVKKNIGKATKAKHQASDILRLSQQDLQKKEKRSENEETWARNQKKKKSENLDNDKKQVEEKT